MFISTKEANYVRKPAPTWQLRLCSLVYPKNKMIRKNLEQRHERYQEQWEIVQKLEKEGKALVLRPSADYGITRYTTDKQALQKWFDLGYRDTKERLPQIMAFLNEEA